MVAVEVREVRARHVQPDAVPLAEPYAGRAQPDSELGIGVWADRTRLRPILIITSMVRALSLASVPAAFALDLLLMEQLYAVALINGVCRTFTSVSFGAYLPKVVGRDNLVEANSKLAASGSVVETSAFSVGGWIAQLAGAIATVVTEALSSVLSALFFLAIRIPESEVSSNDKLQAGLTRICGWAQLPSASGGAGRMCPWWSALWEVSRTTTVHDRSRIGPHGFGYPVHSTGRKGLSSLCRCILGTRGRAKDALNKSWWFAG